MNARQEPPKLLTDVGLNMYVDTFKLANLPLPVEDIAIDKLAWHFAMPVWDKDGTDDWNLTPQEVIDKKPSSTTHQERVANADLAFPIVVTNYKSRLVILDGIHRLVKAYVAGAKTIKAKTIPTEYLSMEKFRT